jgi:hypothetical protein
VSDRRLFALSMALAIAVGTAAGLMVAIAMKATGII